MTDSEFLIAQLRAIRSYRPESYDWNPTVTEPKILDRKLSIVPAPVIDKASDTLESTRALVGDKITEYLNEEYPRRILLIKALPGTGKTTTAVAIAESLASQGRRVAYAGPRHDFYNDLIDKAILPEEWYEWLPRQIGDVENPNNPDFPQTCKYTTEINTWLNRGYEGMTFCAGVCGWDYANKQCKYHRQKSVVNNILFIQHQHIALGHPLAGSFDVLIGDESPIGAFCHHWKIPDRWIMPIGMDKTEPLTEILFIMTRLAQELQAPMSGRDLLDYFGGPEYVLDACEKYTLPIDSDAYVSIHESNEANQVPYFHLPILVDLLVREARCAVEEKEYPHRIILGQKELQLLLRRKAPHLPTHVIWLDATGREDIYSRIFHRKVEVVNARPQTYGKIFQIVDRANNKTTILETERSGNKEVNNTLTKQAHQAEQVIKKILSDQEYKRPTLIGFKSFVEQTELVEEFNTLGHFYAARGTNVHEDADAIFILGSPQASPYDIVRMAKMIYFEDDEAFDAHWFPRDVIYRYIDKDGMGRSYPVGGFWNDSRLQALVESIREDEIIQAAHRGRPVNHPLDIWLFTNVPIDGLPPDELLTMAEVLGVEPGVNIWRWHEFVTLVDKSGADGVAVIDAVEKLGIHRHTAGDYIKRLSSQDGYEGFERKAGMGRPKRAVRQVLDRNL